MHERPTFKPLPALLLLCVFPRAGWDRALADPPGEDEPSAELQVHRYAIASYTNFDWDTDPGRRAAMDLDKFTLEPVWLVAPRLELEAEIEFEHGGTGAAVEFDKFEEFGEFEYEIEKGGEVLLEELHASYEHASWLHLDVGRFELPIGLASRFDEPTESLTSLPSETETSLIPVNWCEIGVRASGRLPRGFSYDLALVNGLDSSGFSSASFVARGHQTRFETVNAEDLAVAARLAWGASDALTVSAAGYHGNSANNRPKPDLAVDAHVTFVEADVAFEHGPWIARGLFLRGTLENAELVSIANRNLSNNLNVKRTPVGSAGQGFFVEAGVDLLALRRDREASLVAFGRYDSVDSMEEVEGTVFDNPRWDRSVWSGGLDWHPVERAAIFAPRPRRSRARSLRSATTRPRSGWRPRARRGGRPACRGSSRRVFSSVRCPTKASIQRSTAGPSTRSTSTRCSRAAMS